MAFSTKQNLVNAKFCQQDGGILTLSGDTSIASVGRLAYLTDQSAVFNVTPLSIPDVQWVTGKTNSVVTCIANNYYNKTQINSYTGQTDTRIDVIELKYLTGATNGIGYTGKNVCLGGALVANTVIGTGSNLFGVNVANINLTGATVSTSGVIKLISTPAAGVTSDDILVWNSSDKTVKVVSGGAVLTSAITGATNGLTKTGQNVKLGGALTEATTITAVNATSLLFTDSRTTPIGIQYGGDYGVNFTARSLPDAGYVTGKTNAVLTCLNTDFYNKTCINAYTGQTLNNINSRLLTSTFATYTGTTVPNTYYNKTCINAYTAATDIRIDNLEIVSNVALTGATNGLTKTGRNVKLGGSLSEVTTISATTHTNCLLIAAPTCISDIHVLKFHEDPTITNFVEGQLFYKDNNLNFQREISGVTLQIGEENVMKVYNNSGSPLLNGKVVYISGAAGAIPTVALASASNEAQAINTIGLLTTNIANGADGYVTTFGLVHDLDTSSWGAGTPLYLSTTAGNLTSTAPVYPNEVVLVGYVTFSDAIAGSIAVTVREQTEYIDYGTFTGYTASTLNNINSRLLISTFNIYTGATDTRIDNIEVITAVAVTGATNGLTCVSPRRIKLGGALTENTTVCSLSNTLTLGKLCTATIDVAGANANIYLLAEDSGSISLQSTTASTFQNTFTNSVGMFIDYNAASESGFMAYDNRPTKRGIQYAADYSATYCPRSLVDKAYVDSVATGLNVHASVQVASTAPLTLSGSQSVDGYSTQNGWRVLVKDQSNQALNGIYISTGVTWQRADDYNFSPLGEISNGDLIPVVSGNTNNNTQWILTTPNPITSGDSLVYSQFSKTITISQGNGIDITPVSGSQQISVELAPNNAGLCFLGTGLRIDNAMFATGLTYFTVGGAARASVNGVYCAPVGSCIPVSINTTGCMLYVDSACVVSAAGAITTANNGLTKQGVNVKLGGALTGDTTITGGGTLDLGFTGLDAFSLGFNSSTITDNSGGEGLVYAANYAPTFIDNSLVSKYFVNNAITGTTLTYNNGLTKAGSVISWGGTLTGNTQVARGGAILCFSCAGITSCIDLFANDSKIHSESTSMCLQSCTTSSCLATICLNNTGEIKLSTNNATLPICITAPQAMKYAANYSSTFTARSIPDAAWVTGLTTTAGLQTANNGLTKVGTNVVLGGALTGNTALTGAYTLSVCGGAKMNTTCGYQISGATILRTSNATIDSIYIGCNAGSNGAGTNNIGIGCGSLKNVTTGGDNTAVGRGTLTGTTIGIGNTALGAYTLDLNISGCYNVGAGFGALSLGTASNFNVAVGYYPMYSNTTGACNIAIGSQTLQNNLGGNDNIALGYGAAYTNNSGSCNITLGYRAGYSRTTGNRNVHIGMDAGYANATGNTNVFIGYCAGLNESTSSKFYLANNSACNLIYGDFVQNFVTLPTVKICNTPATGTNTDGFLVWNTTDKCVKQVNVGSIVSASITGATNGLTKTGQNVKLGGALTETTTINGAQTLRFNISTFNVTGATNIASNIDGNGTLDILGATALRSTLNVTGATTLGSTLNVAGNIDGNGTLDILGATSLRSTLNVTGATTLNAVATYNASKAPFTALQIPEAQWVTGLTSQAILTATNGLTKVGKEVKLGGALTGNTSITGAYLFGVNVTTINLTGTSVNVGGTIKVTTAPAAGTASDSVLVRASDGTVKTVSGAILGDKNNIYAKTTITSNTVLSTGSSYVILVSHAGISLTVTLPSTPINGQAFKVKDITGNALTYPVTVDGNGNLIDGSASGLINTDYGALELMFDTTSDQWYTLAFIN